MKTLRIPSSANEYERVDLTQTQRWLVSGYPKRPASVYALLRVGDPARARAFLRGSLARVDSAAEGRRNDDGLGYKVAIAFTFSGLRMLGLNDAEALETFIPEFRQGMTGAHRARVLGDVGDNASASWAWGAGDREPHVLYALLARDAAELDWPARENELRALRPALELIDAIPCEVSDTEPFGFKDNIAQPFVEDFQGTSKAAPPHEPRVAAGEFVLGYKNEFGQFPASPWVRDETADLPKVVLAQDDRRDLGKNGSFLVVRELHQEVAAFQGLPEEVQEHMIGRKKTGESLVLGAWHSPKDQNDFNYYAEDRYGLRCPMGSHVRRANPRDALAIEELGVTPTDALALANQHRILRRSRVLAPERGPGMLFMCFNTNIDRQFEFVQQTWLDNPKFARSDERDPIVSNHHAGGNTFTYGEGARRSEQANLARYVRTRGGAYFFLPGLKALEHLTRP